MSTWGEKDFFFFFLVLNYSQRHSNALNFTKILWCFPPLQNFLMSFHYISNVFVQGAGRKYTVQSPAISFYSYISNKRSLISSSICHIYTCEKCLFFFFSYELTLKTLCFVLSKGSLNWNVLLLGLSDQHAFYQISDVIRRNMKKV